MSVLRIIAFAAALAAPAALLAQSGADNVADAIPTGDSEMTGFSVPSFDDNNVMTSRLYGDRARVLPDGNVEITGLRLEFYSYEGEGDRQTRKIDMTVTSPLCFYNRNRGVVISDSDVRISREQMVVTGTGFRYNSGNQELKILSNSKVVLQGASRSSLEVDGSE